MKISKKSKSIIIKSFLFASLILLWEVYAIRLNNPLMFPTFSETIKGFFEVIQNGELVNRILS